MKLPLLLPGTLVVLCTTILKSQPLPTRSSKPTVIQVPSKKSNFINPETGESRILFPPVTMPLTNSEGEGGINFFTNYNVDQGLALSSVSCGYTDSKGNLWFGTLGGGVSRYDGKSFTNFTSAQGLANNIVYCIIEDRSGILWFGTSGGGVSRYDGVEFRNYTTAQGLANNTVWSVEEDKNGNLWFGTLGGGVSRYDGKSFTNYTIAQGLGNNKVRSIMQDSKGSLWFATEGGGASSFNGKAFINHTTKEGLAHDVVWSIAEDKTGAIWFGTSGGVSRYDGKSFFNLTSADGLPNNEIYGIAADRTGHIWFATQGGGVSRYDGTTFSNYSTNQGLGNNYVWSITEDKTGNLWFGTEGGGVSRYAGKSITNFGLGRNVAHHSVYSIMEDRQGNLWFGTLGNGVSRYNGHSVTYFTILQGLPNNSIRCILQDNKGNMWFGTDGGGVSYYDGRSFTNFNTTQGLANNIIWSLEEDKSGNIWIGTDGGGVSKYDGKSFTNYTTTQGLANNNVWSILEDRSGNLFFGTYGGGVSRYDGKKFTTYTTADGLANNNVWNIAEDRFGNLWFGTAGGGVSRFDGSVFITFSQAQGLAEDIVYDVVIDAQQNIIIGSKHGFSILKGFSRPNRSDNLIPAVNSERSDTLRKYLPIFELYTKRTGYPIQELNINAMYCDRQGFTWAGSGENQLLKFDYSAVIKNREAPATFIQALKIKQENVGWYNLRKARKSGESNSLADSLVILNEEILAFGKSLSQPERDSLRDRFSGIKFDSIAKFYPLPQNLVLPYQHNSLTFEFVAIEPARPFLVRYQYMLEGYDKDWNPITDKTSATFGNIREGHYTFKLKARNPEGIWSDAITYSFKILPPWYRMWWAYLLYLFLFAAVLWGIIRYRSRTLLKEKSVLEEKVKQRTNELSRSIQELKETQAQLLQQEKMATLGELTAGIAHEIQNPLNFVNNFSEVNSELISEMKQEIAKGNKETVNALANDIEANEQKIIFHGKRADGIVKNMLQHCRKSVGQKEQTDINALVNEYLRLAYHGLRAKNKSFNATMITDFDPNLGLIDIIPQDLGRVILNLVTNAFYAVTEKKGILHNSSTYEPTVTVSTKKMAGFAEIRIKDNGTGMSEKTMTKIFQPFFTTKPTQQGTGLGLSISYDIVTKVHNGQIEARSKEGEYAEFIITLPL